jgi:hypothetical protein
VTLWNKRKLLTSQKQRLPDGSACTSYQAIIASPKSNRRLE